MRLQFERWRTFVDVAARRGETNTVILVGTALRGLRSAGMRQEITTVVEMITGGTITESPHAIPKTARPGTEMIKEIDQVIHTVALSLHLLTATVSHRKIVALRMTLTQIREMILREVIPGLILEMIDGQILEMIQDLTLEVTLEMTPDLTLEMTPVPTLEMTPEVTPHLTPEVITAAIQEDSQSRGLISLRLPQQAIVMNGMTPLSPPLITPVLHPEVAT